ncbi:MAG: hydroxymethylglutaryl-CoA lyase [Acidimicrobiales bacterium]
MVIREVGPRDGLQVERPVAVADRARLVRALVSAGLREVEVASFVSERLVPAMAGAGELVAELNEDSHDGVTYIALVPNARGAEAALAAGVGRLSFTASASETYSRRNVNRSIDEVLVTAREVVGVAGGVAVEGVVSCSFGCPYEGPVAPAVVASVAARLIEAGLASVILADTTGEATPSVLSRAIEATGPGVGLHLHDSRGTALVSAYVALGLGVNRFETSLGGLGGSPSAPAPVGNLSTGLLAYLLRAEGVATGIDLDRLAGAVRLASELIGRPLPGTA